MTAKQVVALTCMEDGCTNEGMECFLPDDETDASCAYCHEHIFDNGFCKGCGQFWGGVESFEFLNGGYCDDCKTTMDLEDTFDHDEPDEDWDPYDDDSADGCGAAHG